MGNRSLLADPWKYPKRTGHNEVDVKKMVNKIKGREEFRPFAPMMLKENVNRFFRNGIPSPFMNGVREALHEVYDHYPSIIHIDGTSRIQEVTEEPHRTLLEEWEKETGCPMLLNTSLNIKGEPIVNTKEDANKFQSKTGVKVL